MHWRWPVIIGAALLAFCRCALAQPGHDPTRECWATTPATRGIEIDESFPLGNGRLGVLLPGGVERDSIPVFDRAAGGIVGKLALEFEGRTQAQTYERSLALDRGVATVRYRVGDTLFTRECFVSRPDQVVVVRLTADKGGRISVGVRFDAGENGRGETLGEDTLVFSGAHSLRIGVQRSGGKFNATDDSVQVIKANSVTIVLASDDRGEDGHERVVEDVAYALRRPYNELRDRHTTDVSALFNRCVLEIAPGDGAARATTERLRDPDPALGALQFSACRYLMIAGFRSGGSSPALLWRERQEPGDASAFVACEGVNLAECHEPLLAFAETHAGDEEPSELVLAAGLGLLSRAEYSRSAKHVKRALAPTRALAETVLSRGKESGMAREFMARSAGLFRGADEDAALLARLETLASPGSAPARGEALDGVLARRWAESGLIFGPDPGATMALAADYLDALARVRTAVDAPEIDLLPGLPAGWREGRIRGLRLPGGFSVDVTWSEGRIKSARVTDSVLGDVGASPDPEKLRAAADAGCTAGARVRVVRKKGEERFTLEIVTPERTTESDSKQAPNQAPNLAPDR